MPTPRFPQHSYLDGLTQTQQRLINGEATATATSTGAGG